MRSTRRHRAGDATPAAQAGEAGLGCADLACNLVALRDQACEDVGIGHNANTRYGNKLVSYPLSCIVGSARRTPTKNRYGKGTCAPREAPFPAWETRGQILGKVLHKAGSFKQTAGATVVFFAGLDGSKHRSHRKNRYRGATGSMRLSFSGLLREVGVRGGHQTAPSPVRDGVVGHRCGVMPDDRGDNG